MKRFFVPSERIKDGIVTLIGSDTNHVKNVLRLKSGGNIIILDNQNNEYAAKITSTSNDKIICKITSKRENKSEPRVKVTIAQGLPKNQKMDLIIQKCTELGAYRIIPVECERSIAKLGQPKERWNKIAQSAAEQSGRLIIPEIISPAPFDEVIKTKGEYDLKLILWEEEKTTSLKSILAGKSKIESVIVLIGPEGGFSIDEVESSKKNGYMPVTLGPRILRTETASIFLLSILMHEFE